MIQKKITTGVVEQVYCTGEDGLPAEFTSQRFIALDNPEYEDEDGNRLAHNKASEAIRDAYLPFDMVQPKSDREKRILEYALNFLSANLDEDSLYDLFPNETPNVETQIDVVVSRVIKEINALSGRFQ